MPKEKKLLKLIEENGILGFVRKRYKFSLDSCTSWLLSFEVAVQKQPKWTLHLPNTLSSAFLHNFLLAKENFPFQNMWENTTWPALY